jgi:hypothetical protein
VRCSGSPQAAFGWDVFNKDSLNRAYDRRLDTLAVIGKAGASGGGQASASAVEYGQVERPSEAALDRMVRRRRARRAARAERARGDGYGSMVSERARDAHRRR